jgi:hypothetical protein
LQSSRGLKQVILGLAVVGFAVVLAIASLAPPIVELNPFVVLFAIVVGLGGLTIAYWGTMRDD